MRLSITDRCNLRCRYCMPPEGVSNTFRDRILSYEELLRLARIFVNLGIRKVRVTGGEPFVRKGFMGFIGQLKEVSGIHALHITTNGAALADRVGELATLSIDGINLSLDTLKPDRFRHIARKDLFVRVRAALDAVLAAGIPLKINTVVQCGVNTDEIAALASLARSHPLTVRFIEEMPFNGLGERVSPCWESARIQAELERQFPGMKKVARASGTADLYHVPAFIGTIGIIGAYSRQFCGSCNRIRITSQGMLKTCLYGDACLDLRKMLRRGDTDEEIRKAVLSAVAGKPKNGFVAEGNNNRRKKSMAAIGG